MKQKTFTSSWFGSFQAKWPCNGRLRTVAGGLLRLYGGGATVGLRAKPRGAGVSLDGGDPRVYRNRTCGDRHSVRARRGVCHAN